MMGSKEEELTAKDVNLTIHRCPDWDYALISCDDHEWEACTCKEYQAMTDEIEQRYDWGRIAVEQAEFNNSQRNENYRKQLWIGVAVAVARSERVGHIEPGVYADEALKWFDRTFGQKDDG